MSETSFGLIVDQAVGLWVGLSKISDVLCIMPLRADQQTEEHNQPHVHLDTLITKW